MKNNKGFTLIELLVVVLIIGILSAIALPQYFKAVEKARGAEALQLFGAIAGAQQRYYLTRDEYATEFNLLDLDLTDKDGKAVGGVSSYNTKNFKIEIGGSDKNAYIKATRSGGRYKYQLCKNFNDGHLECDGTKGKDICPTLGEFSNTPSEDGSNVTCAAPAASSTN